MQWNEFIEKPTELESSHDQNEEYDFVSLLICRCLLCSQFEGVHPDRITEVLKSIGVSVPGDDDDLGNPREKNKNEGKLREEVQQARDAILSRHSGEIRLAMDPLVTMIQERLQLNEAERRLLILVILKSRDQRFKSMLHQTQFRTMHKGMKLVGQVLGVRDHQVAEALSSTSNLVRMELIDTSPNIMDLDDLVSEGKMMYQLRGLFRDSGANNAVIVDRIMRSICPLAPETDLGLKDFDGFGDLELMRNYLTQSKPGLNILLYGPPGTGKTELARVLAKSLGKTLYEVPTQTRNRQPVTGNDRLHSARVAQLFLKDQKDVLLLFDELEDAFRSQQNLGKAWLNQHLETNTVPTIWISNRVEDVDPAFLRRFDLIQEIQAGKNLRDGVSEQVRGHLQNLPVPAQWVEHVMTQKWATPALLNNLCELGELLPQDKPNRNMKRLEHAVTQKLRPLKKSAPTGVAQHKTPNESPLRKGVPQFQLAWLNTRPSLRSMEGLLQRTPSAKLCLYGPPGSGKTAFARHIANALGKPFELVSGSDLLSKYVGESEQHVRDMFRAAETEDSLLLIDEADSFLASRNDSSYSWQVTLTNEFMVQLDQFQGMVMITTNRFEYLDAAIMRRLHLKVEFRAMTRAQVVSMLKSCVSDPEAIEHAEPEQISALSELTPGLVVNAIEQLNLLRRPIRTRTLLRAALEEQRQQSLTASQPIGFTVPLSGAPGD